ncbi:MAG: hypothetical protein CMJ25_02450 [Phycisphaerae bacterium]|nr:hypothetical protein [Phycisphaerae bacterium]
MPKKVKKTNWGDFYRSEEQFKAMQWCIKNNIIITPLAATAGNAPQNFWIEITIQGRVSKTPKTYNAKEVYPQIYEYYKYYYDKHRNRI